MLTLVIGGSGSGKSTYAENLLVSREETRIYIACMLPYGPEATERIARHRALRAGKGFTTVERYIDIAKIALPSDGTALIECLCNLVANEMFEKDGAGAKTADAVVSGVLALASSCREVVAVTNDVASAGDLSDPSTRAYVETLGEVNARLAKKADRVIELVAGIPLILKGGSPCAS